MLTPANLTTGKEPRYYQQIAINATVQAILKGKRRVLLTMATGTGKTVVAFQICWKLWSSRWNRSCSPLASAGRSLAPSGGEGQGEGARATNPLNRPADTFSPSGGEGPDEGASDTLSASTGSPRFAPVAAGERDGVRCRTPEHRKPRILYLADRNFLVDDPKDKIFAPFGDARHKIEGGVVSHGRELYFSTYQSLAKDERRPGLYREFAPDFFDLIIVDECHRGSAKEDSNWREILEYFSPAYQLGMTATPLRDENRDTHLYFGNPIYTYSLKQGIDDGFLAPYRVHRIVTQWDAAGWRPSQNDLDRYGRQIPDEEYRTADFERLVALRARTQAIARHLTDFLKRTDRFAKTIVFCVDQEHASEMRAALNNLNADLVGGHPPASLAPTGGEGQGEGALHYPRPSDGRGAGGEGASTPLAPTGGEGQGEGALRYPRPSDGRGAGGEGASTSLAPIGGEGQGEGALGLPDYVCRVTADEGDIGRGHMQRFQDVETRTPVILTTSQLLTTGLDAPTCRNVVLVRLVNSMVEFKQIIGRGTRVRDDYGKLWFNILDYTGTATRNFADPQFDGDPAFATQEEIDEYGQTTNVEIETTEESEGNEGVAGEEQSGTGGPTVIVEHPPGSRRKYYFDGGQVEIAADLVYELDADGTQLRVIKLSDYTVEQVRSICRDPGDLQSQWSNPERRREILNQFAERGIDFPTLAAQVGQRTADPFDVLCHLAFNAPLLTRRQRADRVKQQETAFFNFFAPEAREILGLLLEKYASDGELQFTLPDVLKLPPISQHGTVGEIAIVFGGHDQLRDAVNQLQTLLYA